MGILRAELYSSPVGKIGTGTVPHSLFFRAESYSSAAMDTIALTVESYSSIAMGTM